MAKKKKKISKPVKKQESFVEKHNRIMDTNKQFLREAKIPRAEHMAIVLKSDKFNAQYVKTGGYGVDVQMLEKVYLRGSESLVEDPQHRVNQFMYLVRSGKPLNPEYTQDFDLLPEGHPKK